MLIIEEGIQLAKWTLYTLIRSYSKYRVPAIIVFCNSADILLCLPEYEIAVYITSARKDEKENITYQ